MSEKMNLEIEQNFKSIFNQCTKVTLNISFRQNVNSWVSLFYLFTKIATKKGRAKTENKRFILNRHKQQNQ